MSVRRSKSTSSTWGLLLLRQSLLIGYARVSTDAQDLTAQRDGLLALGVDPGRLYVDHGLTGANRERPACARRWPPAGRVTPLW